MKASSLKNSIIFKNRSFRNSRIALFILLILMVLFAIVNGLYSSNISDFFYINGDNQNYNPVRRLLDGQVPYKDFPVYLGMGHLYTIAFVLSLVGNSFANSIFASSMVNFLLAQIGVALILYLFLDNLNYALLACIVSVGLFMFMYNNYQILLYQISKSIFMGTSAIVEAGNSARIIRIAGMFCMISLYISGVKILRILLAHRLNTSEWPYSVWAGFICGLFLTWSNEMAPAIYLSFSFAYFCMILIYYKCKIKPIIISILQYVASSVIGLLVAVAITSQGNFRAWIHEMFSTGKYQSWYFQYSDAKHSSFTQITIGNHMLCLILLGLAYALMIFSTRNRIEQAFRYAMLMVISITTVFAALLYDVFSSSWLNEPLYYVLFANLIGIVFYLVKILYGKWKLANKKRILSCLLIVGFISSLYFISDYTSHYWLDKKNYVENPEEYPYFEPLGGRLSRSLANDLQIASQRLEGENLFSTYGGALEAANGIFQPSGIDYIIHVSSDEKRAEYLSVFGEGNFKYATTIRESYTPWEVWIRNANWFFYRELYASYKPEFATNGQIFWTRTDRMLSRNEEITTIVKQVDDSVVEFYFESENKQLCGTIDLKIDYEVKANKNEQSFLTYNSFVYVQELSEQKIREIPKFSSFYLPSLASTYIPVTMVDGKGSVRLTGKPMESSSIVVDNYEIVNFFSIQFDSIFPIEAKDNVLVVERSKLALKSLEDAEELISVFGETIRIERIDLSEHFIYVYTSKTENIEDFGPPYAVQLKKLH